MINITPSQEITKIYLVTNCFGDPNKVYIGKTKNKTRIYRHRKTFGQQITYDYIDEIPSLNKNDWKPLECFWINYFRFLGFEVQNKNNGGGGALFYNQDIKNKISLNRKNKGIKSIIQYNISGEFIREWKSAIDIEKELGFSSINILHNCRKTTRSAFNFIWKFKYDNINMKFDGLKSRKGKPILQYDLEGNFIRKWKNAKEASIFYGKTNGSFITSCCKKKSQTAFGYVWRYINEPLNIDFKLINYKNSKNIIHQYNLDGVIIKTWLSRNKACNELNINSYKMNLICEGKLKSKNGIILRYGN